MILTKEQVKDLWDNLVWEMDVLDGNYDIRDFKKILDKTDIDYES